MCVIIQISTEEIQIILLVRQRGATTTKIPEVLLRNAIHCPQGDTRTEITPKAEVPRATTTTVEVAVVEAQAKADIEVHEGDKTK